MASSIEHTIRNLLRRAGMEITPTRRRQEANLLGWHLSRVFEVLNINVVLDVGARHGEYGTFLRRNGYRGRIVSFEPVASNLARLQRVASRDPAWAVRDIALGSEDGEADIHVAANTSLSSLRSASDYGRRDFAGVIATDRIERITVRRLDAIWQDVLTGTADPRVYLKLDTQGWDLEVLAGAGDRTRDILALQTEAAVRNIYAGAPSHLVTLEVLEQAGFTPSGMFPVTLDKQMGLVEYDCVAVRSS